MKKIHYSITFATLFLWLVACKNLTTTKSTATQIKKISIYAWCVEYPCDTCSFTSTCQTFIRNEIKDVLNPESLLFKTDSIAVLKQFSNAFYNSANKKSFFQSKTDVRLAILVEKTNLVDTIVVLDKNNYILNSQQLVTSPQNLSVALTQLVKFKTSPEN